MKKEAKPNFVLNNHIANEIAQQYKFQHAQVFLLQMVETDRVGRWGMGACEGGNISLFTNLLV